MDLRVSEKTCGRKNFLLDGLVSEAYTLRHMETRRETSSRRPELSPDERRVLAFIAIHGPVDTGLTGCRVQNSLRVASKLRQLGLIGYTRLHSGGAFVATVAGMDWLEGES